jgi:RIO kinase 1
VWFTRRNCVQIVKHWNSAKTAKKKLNTFFLFFRIKMPDIEETAALQRRNGGADKQERATVEQVIDPKTRILLFKLINNGFISEIFGCMSTGKEANVYHASRTLPDTEEVQRLAIKIYKTSILVFKDRDRYVSGEYRFRHGYCKSNPRKMVKVWAEKEFRNLRRLGLAGIIFCPTMY